MKNYKQYVTEKIGKEFADRKGDAWRDGSTAHDYICKDLKDNFIDGNVPEMCAVKGDLFAFRKIHYHRWAKCLTSSQVMCINFFKKFFEQEDNDRFLLELLEHQCGLPFAVSDVTIKDAVFEYEPDSEEKTNFDFYLRLSNNQQIFFEIKYTEQEFGGINPSENDPNKYDRKWEKIYKEMVEKCPHFQGTAKRSKEEFYKNYQINRNIAHARTKHDIIVFLTPRANSSLDSGRAYIDSFQNPHIVNLYWEDLLEYIRPLVRGWNYFPIYFHEFWKKYLAFVPEGNYGGWLFWEKGRERAQARSEE